MSRQLTRACAVFAALLAPALAFAQAPTGPGPAPAAVVAPPVLRGDKVGGRVVARDLIRDRLATGFHAVLFIRDSPFDSEVCRKFVHTYGDGFSYSHENEIVFAKRPTYARNPPQYCEQLSESYDINVWSDLDDDLDLYALGAQQVLMIVCRDGQRRLINKGYLIFKTGDDIQQKFFNFAKYYKLGPQGWIDKKWIDQPADILDVTGWAYHLVNPPKNTPCRM